MRQLYRNRYHVYFVAQDTSYHCNDATVDKYKVRSQSGEDYPRPRCVTKQSKPTHIHITVQCSDNTHRLHRIYTRTCYDICTFYTCTQRQRVKSPTLKLPMSQLAD